MRIPELHQLEAIAAEAGLRPTAAELQAFRDGMEFWWPIFEDLDALEQELPPVRQTVRDPGYQPKPEDNPYNAFITKCFVKGADKGPLKGKTVALKDNIAVAGVPMTLASRVMEGYIPDQDATIVTRLLDAGADIVGKLNMDNFSMGSHGFGTGIGDYPRVENPHNPEHLTGGSSSGSGAAAAANLVDIAIGGDQGGSIRIPASWCGVVGIKPTHGLVPHTAIVGVEPLIDYTGPMARRVEDVALALQVMAGPDGYDPRQVDVPPNEPYAEMLDGKIAGMRIGVLREGFGQEGAEPDVDAKVREAIDVLKKLGAKVSEVSIPEHLTYGRVPLAFVFFGTYMLLHTYGNFGAQGWHHASFEEAFAKMIDGRLDDLPPRLKFSLVLGKTLGNRFFKYHAKAHNLTLKLRKAYDRMFEEVDCIVMPTVPKKAPRYVPPKDELEAQQRAMARRHGVPITRNTGPFNVTGHPGLSVPVGYSEGMPVGMMLVGPKFSDGKLLNIAYAYQQSVDWDSYFANIKPWR